MTERVKQTWVGRNSSPAQALAIFHRKKHETTALADTSGARRKPVVRRMWLPSLHCDRDGYESWARQKKTGTGSRGWSTTSAPERRDVNRNEVLSRRPLPSD